MDAPPVWGVTQHEELAEVGLDAGAVGQDDHGDGLLAPDERDLAVNLGRDHLQAALDLDGGEGAGVEGVDGVGAAQAGAESGMISGSSA